MVKNYMEVLVDDVMRELIRDKSINKCEELLSDIRAMALNSLPPMYFLSTVDEGRKKAFLLEKQRRITVLAKVIEAANLLCSKEDNEMRKAEGIL